MMNETYLINHVKERLCYVPLDFMKELEITKLYVKLAMTNASLTCLGVGARKTP